MNIDPNQLINGHLDCSLSPVEYAELNDWIKADPSHADRFVSMVMLDNRICVHYQSLKATIEHLDSLRLGGMPQKRRSRRVTIGASIACLLLMAVLYLGVPTGTIPSVTAVAEFHDLMKLARRPGDRTYHVKFVRDKSDSSVGTGDTLPNGKQVNKGDGRGDEALLYVRDGRQFVYTWTSVDGRQSFIGSNGRKSWAYRVGEKLDENDDPTYYSGGLPGGNYLAPIMSFFDGQEKMLVADYNLEIHHPSRTEKVIFAGKKPDTKQGPRRIEITFQTKSGLISQMRIWPETPDHHKKMNFDLIELASETSLDPEFFAPVYHMQHINRPGTDTRGAAD